MTRNFVTTQAALGLSTDEVYALGRNAFLAAFVPEDERRCHLAALDECWRAAGAAVPHA